MHFRSERTEGQESGQQEALRVPIDEIKDQWRSLWRNRVDDKVRAEGIATEDYSLLFVDRGTVIAATKDFKPLNFREILEEHGVKRRRSPHPSVGGYRKFARTVLNKQSRARRWKAKESKRKRRKKKNQQKKGGRGWLHISL